MEGSATFVLRRTSLGRLAVTFAFVAFQSEGLV